MMTILGLLLVWTAVGGLVGVTLGRALGRAAQLVGPDPLGAAGDAAVRASSEVTETDGTAPAAA